MDPNQYYETLFPEHFSIFWDSLKQHGSLSRRRGAALRLGVNTGLTQSTAYFSCYDLGRFDDSPDHLEAVPHKHHLDFLFSLFIQVMLDQVFHTHFPADYLRFKKHLTAPKMDATAAIAGSAKHANPYHLFCPEILMSRSWSQETIFERFSLFAESFVEIVTELSKNPGLPPAKTIFTRVIQDEDCLIGSFGKHLKTLVEGKI